MITPRDKFRLDGTAVSQHAKLVDDPFLEKTLETALSHMLWTQEGQAPSDPFRLHERLEGAKAFLLIWRALSSPVMETYPPLGDGGLVPERDTPLKWRTK